MSLDTALIKNERYTHSQVSAPVQSSWQKKRRTTKRKTETTTHEDGTSLDGLYPVADDNENVQEQQ